MKLSKITLLVVVLAFFVCSAFIKADINKPKTLQIKSNKQKIHSFTKPDLDAYGIKSMAIENETPWEAHIRVRYHIPKNATRPCKIIGYIPSKNEKTNRHPAATNRVNCKRPTATEGVDGQALIKFKYRRTAVLNTNKVEFVISSGGETIVSRSFDYNKQWGMLDLMKDVCRIDEIRRLDVLDYKVKFQIKYYLKPSFPRGVKVGVKMYGLDPSAPPNLFNVENVKLNRMGSAGYKLNRQFDVSRSTSGKHTPRHSSNWTGHFDVVYTGENPFTMTAMEVFLYYQNKSTILCSMSMNWNRTWFKYGWTIPR